MSNQEVTRCKSRAPCSLYMSYLQALAQQIHLCAHFKLESLLHSVSDIWVMLCHMRAGLSNQPIRDFGSHHHVNEHENAVSHTALCARQAIQEPIPCSMHHLAATSPSGRHRVVDTKWSGLATSIVKHLAKISIRTNSIYCYEPFTPYPELGATPEIIPKLLDTLRSYARNRISKAF
jgi:hypothetical protein